MAQPFKVNRIQLSAVCTNKACRTVYLTPFGIGLSEGASMQLVEFSPTHCPKCESPGIVPNAEYTVVGSQTLVRALSSTDQELLDRTLNLVRSALDSNMSPEDFKKEAARQAPELSALWKLLPVNPQDAYQFWMLVLVALGTLLMAYQTFTDSGPQQITVPQEIIDAIRLSRPDVRDSSHKEPSK